jgi:hypothetical protein
MKMTWRIVSEGLETADTDDTYVQPVDVLVPVVPCDGHVGNVRLLGIVLGVAVGFVGARHGARLLDVVGVNGLHARNSLVRRHVCVFGRWIRRGKVSFIDGGFFYSGW